MYYTSLAPCLGPVPGSSPHGADPMAGSKSCQAPGIGHPGPGPAHPSAWRGHVRMDPRVSFQTYPAGLLCKTDKRQNEALIFPRRHSKCLSNFCD